MLHSSLVGIGVDDAALTYDGAINFTLEASYMSVAASSCTPWKSFLWETGGWEACFGQVWAEAAAYVNRTVTMRINASTSPCSGAPRYSGAIVVLVKQGQSALRWQRRAQPRLKTLFRLSVAVIRARYSDNRWQGPRPLLRLLVPENVGYSDFLFPSPLKMRFAGRWRRPGSSYGRSL
jgi:hypothetical protein